MRRVVVVGGRGYFGSLLVAELRSLGIRPLVASRRGDADLRLDAEDAEGLRAALRPGDLVLDAAGPFQARSTRLVEAAVEVGFDLIDLADGAGFVQRVRVLGPRVEQAGVRVLTACSSISAGSAALVRLSGAEAPVRLTAFLAPATRATARPATARALLRSVGAPVLVLREGRLVTRTGWSEPRDLPVPPPIGVVRGRLLESADAVTLPPVWPTLRTVEFFAAARVPGLDGLLAVAARSRAVRALVRGSLRGALPLARLLGSRQGAFGVEVEDAAGRVRRLAWVAARESERVSVAPASLAARAILDGRPPAVGVVAPDRHVDPYALVRHLEDRGVLLVGREPA